jgi:hypothetical protein
VPAQQRAQFEHVIAVLIRFLGIGDEHPHPRRRDGGAAGELISHAIPSETRATAGPIAALPCRIITQTHDAQHRATGSVEARRETRDVAKIDRVAVTPPFWPAAATRAVGMPTPRRGDGVAPS